MIDNLRFIMPFVEGTFIAMVILFIVGLWVSVVVGIIAGLHYLYKQIANKNQTPKKED